MQPLGRTRDAWTARAFQSNLDGCDAARRSCVAVYRRRMQRGERSRVSDPVIEPLEAVTPVDRLGRPRITSPADRAASRVELLTTAAYEAHAQRMRAFAIAATRDGNAADDLVQETFLRFVRQLQARREPDNVGGWLYRVCGNLIVSRSRRKSVVERLRGWVGREQEPSPEDLVLTAERDRTLAIALSRLPADARVALLLASRGMTAAEIGLAIHRTPVATRTFLFRARVRLRDELAALGVEGPR